MFLRNVWKVGRYLSGKCKLRRTWPQSRAISPDEFLGFSRFPIELAGTDRCLSKPATVNGIELCAWVHWWRSEGILPATELSDWVKIYILGEAWKKLVMISCVCSAPNDARGQRFDQMEPEILGLKRYPECQNCKHSLVPWTEWAARRDGNEGGERQLNSSKKMGSFVL